VRINDAPFTSQVKPKSSALDDETPGGAQNSPTLNAQELLRVARKSFIRVHFLARPVQRSYSCGFTSNCRGALPELSFSA
jgi:hypothetical protein